MSIHQLGIGWARTANERRYLHWELQACEEVLGVFSTGRDDVLAVLFGGDRHRFHAWARSLESPSSTEPTRSKGALQ